MSETQAPVPQPPVPVANATPAVNFAAAEAAAYEAARAAIVGETAGETTPATTETPAAPAAPAAQQPAAEQSEQDPWAIDPAALAPKEPSIEEIIKQRIERRKQSQQQPQTAQQQAQAAQQPLMAVPQGNLLEYQRLIQEGKPNEALKALGVSQTLEDLQRAELKRLGVLKEVTDPRVDSALKELEALKEREKQQQQAESQARAQQAAREAYQADLQAVAREITNSGLPGADEFVKLPDVPAMVLQHMVQHEVGVLEATKFVRANVRNLYEGLKSVFEPSSAPTVATQAVPGRPTPNVIPNGASASPVIPQNLGYDDAWALTRQMFVEGKL